MFPASRSGNTRTFALPATSLPGALEAPTLGTIAASSWNSPSSLSSGCSSFAILVASTILSTSGCFALPFVECESMATIGSSSTRSWKDSAEDAAIAESSSGVGFWFRPESANTNAPFAPYSQSGTTIRKNADTSFVPGLVFRICRHGRSVSAVEWHAPDTIPSASPIFTIITP